jgi:hypothetical protein
MTDLDPAPEPDVLAALRAWAAATDPGADLVGGPTIRAGTTGRARWARHRALLIAAAVLVVLLAGAAVWALGDDEDAGRVTTDPEPTVLPDAGVPLDVVVDTSGLTGDPLLSRHTFEIDLPGQGRTSILDGTSLVLSEEVPDGSTWRITISTWTCGAFSCATDPDGTPPGDDPEVLVECSADLTLRGPTLATVGLFGPADRPDCAVSRFGPVPALTVPPAFTLRDPYRHDCGTGVGEIGGADGFPDADSWDCLVGALAGDDPVELVVYEQGDGGPITRSWWRAGEDEGLTIIRQPGEGGRWTQTTCDALEESVFGPEGTPVARGCDPDTELDLAYAGPRDREPSGPLIAEPVPLDLVVVHADAADDPTIVDRWVLTDEGIPVAAGPLEAAATALGTWDLARTGITSIRWDRYVCEGVCPPSTGDGRPIGDDAEVSTICETGVPIVAARATVRFRTAEGAPGGGLCEVVTTGGLPPLTVPPAWTLREPYGSSCGADVPPTPQRSGCLFQAFEAGERVEMEATDGDGRRIVWRVGGGGVTIIRPPSEAGAPWTEQLCTGLDLVTPAAPPYIAPQGCQPELPMSLEPPA